MITATSYKSASTPTRRRDTHANRHGARPSVARYSIRTNYSAAQLARGTDDHGRFIGPHDVERAAEHFWRAPHRRSQAPIVRADPVFDEALGARKVKVLRPRAAKSGLTPDDIADVPAFAVESPERFDITISSGVKTKAAAPAAEGEE